MKFSQWCQLLYRKEQAVIWLSFDENIALIFQRKSDTGWWNILLIFTGSVFVSHTLPCMFQYSFCLWHEIYTFDCLLPAKSFILAGEWCLLTTTASMVKACAGALPNWTFGLNNKELLCGLIIGSNVVVYITFLLYRWIRLRLLLLHDFLLYYFC